MSSFEALAYKTSSAQQKFSTYQFVRRIDVFMKEMYSWLVFWKMKSQQICWINRIVNRGWSYLCDEKYQPHDDWSWMCMTKRNAREQLIQIYGLYVRVTVSTLDGVYVHTDSIFGERKTVVENYKCSKNIWDLGGLHMIRWRFYCVLCNTDSFSSADSVRRKY